MYLQEEDNYCSEMLKTKLFRLYIENVRDTFTTKVTKIISLQTISFPNIPLLIVQQWFFKESDLKLPHVS